MPAQTYVGLLYGYLYTDGNLGRVRGASPSAGPENNSKLVDYVGGGRENDRVQYEEYEQGVLRDLLGVYSPMELPSVANSPPPQRHDEHVNTLRSEYKEYKAEALDAFELSILVDGSLRHLHPAPGSSGCDDQAQLRATYAWDKRTLFEALQTVAGGRPVGSGGVIEILVTSKVDSRLAQHYIQKAMTGRKEGRMNLPGQARLTGRSRQRPLLSRCYCARALCMMMEADGAAAVRASRESFKRIVAQGGEDAPEALRAIGRCRYAELGSPKQVAFFASGFPATFEQLNATAPDQAQGNGASSLPTRFKAAESVFVRELGLPDGSNLIDPKRTYDDDLSRLCEQLERRFEFAATRELAVPDRDHFLMGLSVGVALSWVASGLVAVAMCTMAGFVALVLASVFLENSLVPIPAWCRRAAGTDGAGSDVATDACSAAAVGESRDRGLAPLCWGCQLHAMGVVSKVTYFLVPEALTDTRAMLAWVSQLLGISLGGLLAAAFAALGVVTESGSSVADFTQRFLYAAL